MFALTVQRRWDAAIKIVLFQTVKKKNLGLPAWQTQCTQLNAAEMSKPATFACTDIYPTQISSGNAKINRFNCSISVSLLMLSKDKRAGGHQSRMPRMSCCNAGETKWWHGIPSIAMTPRVIIFFQQQHQKNCSGSDSKAFRTGNRKSSQRQVEPNKIHISSSVWNNCPESPKDLNMMTWWASRRSTLQNHSGELTWFWEGSQVFRVQTRRSRRDVIWCYQRQENTHHLKNKWFSV